MALWVIVDVVGSPTLVHCALSLLYQRSSVNAWISISFHLFSGIFEHRQNLTDGVENFSLDALQIDELSLMFIVTWYWFL